MYNFIPYESRGSNDQSHIAINKSGEITFSSKFCYENKIFSYINAKLFWDIQAKVIGISLTNDKNDKGTYKLKRTSRGAGARIAAQGFLKKNKIDFNKYSGRYSWKRYEDPAYGSLFIFDLTQR